MTMLEPSPAAAAAAQEVDQRIRGNVRRMRGLWVEIAEDLHRFHRAKQWADLGFPTFEAWLEQPDLELERRWTYQLIATYEQLVVQHGVDPVRLQGIEVSKAAEILPAVRRETVGIDEALSDAETLNTDDLRARYRGAASSSSPGRFEQRASIDPGRNGAAAPAPRSVSTCPTCGQVVQTR